MAERDGAASAEAGPFDGAPGAEQPVGGGLPADDAQRGLPGPADDLAGQQDHLADEALELHGDVLPAVGLQVHHHGEMALEDDGSILVRVTERLEACPGYDTRRREWRNLDAWGYSTFLVCDVPRMRCREHGVVTMQVPWAEGSSRYTAEFEAEAIRWLKEASVQAVAQRMRLSRNAADGIMQRAVARGLARRPRQAVRHLSVDETAFRRRHQYVTVVSNPKEGIVLHVAQGRGKQALKAFYEGLGKARRAAVESVSMDMWGPYIAATLEMIPEALKKIAFDRFHVAKHLGDAGAARGAPGALEGGKRNPHGVEVPVAEGPWTEDAPGEAGVRQAPSRARGGRPRLGS